MYLRGACCGLFFVSFAGFAWIGSLLIGQASQIIHACVECQRNAFTLLKGKMPGTALDFRIIALVDPRQHLHLNLREAPFFPEVLQSCHFITLHYYVNLTY